MMDNDDIQKHLEQIYEDSKDSMVPNLFRGIYKEDITVDDLISEALEDVMDNKLYLNRCCRKSGGATHIRNTIFSSPTSRSLIFHRTILREIGSSSKLLSSSLSIPFSSFSSR